MNSRNFFSELKRRNVYKVAVAYIVAGWALSQGIAQVFPVFDVPNWTIRLLVVFIIIGLPIALVLAWTLEITPEGAALGVLARHPSDEFAGTLLILLGEPEQSFTWFERSGTGLSGGYLNWLWWPQDYARKGRQHPAFQSFAKRIGLVDYWKHNRWPDICQPAPERGSDAFTCQ